jgi:CBS domain-containing protein
VLVREVMTTSPVTVTPEASTKDALRLLDRHSITSMPVVDPDGVVIGVVSEADLVRDALAPDPRAHMLPMAGERETARSRVEDVMTRHPVTVRGDLDLAEATELIISTAVKSVPVVDGSRLVGMISRRDVVHALARADTDVESQLDDLYRTLGVDWTVEVHDGAVTVEGPVGANARALAETAAGTVPGVVSVTVVEGVPPARRTTHSS